MTADGALRTLIVDDEPLAREGIRMMLERDDDFEVVGECPDGRRALESIRATAPDVLFLDVQMPDLDGFGVLEKMDALDIARPPVIVFVTAYDHYALKAFEVHAVDYVLKPFDDERFARTLEHVKLQARRERSQDLSRRLMRLVREFDGGGARETEDGAGGREYLARLSVKSGGRIHFLRVEEIDWIEAADYYVKLHVGERHHLLRESLNQLERRLDPTRFFRIHRSTIVNLERVRGLEPRPAGDGVVNLEGGTDLRCSRSRRDELQERLAGLA